MPRILVHICCGPCAITTVQTLLDEGFAVTGLFLNPNIHPAAEYLRRRDGALEVAEKMGFKLIVKDGEYDPQAYFRAVAFRETNRCFHCYSMRLERTANMAENGGFDAWTTSLLYSKFQKHETIRDLGRDLGGRFYDLGPGTRQSEEMTELNEQTGGKGAALGGDATMNAYRSDLSAETGDAPAPKKGRGKARAPFLYRDFRAGWKQGIEISKAWGIYRQEYCGCLYSELERRARELGR